MSEGYQCLVCGHTYATKEVGGGRYPIQPVPQWANAPICETCRSSNWDGIVPGKPLLEAHFKKHGITPAINDRGWWSIPG